MFKISGLNLDTLTKLLVNVFEVCVRATDSFDLLCSADEVLTVGILWACFYCHLENRTGKVSHRSSCIN